MSERLNDSYILLTEKELVELSEFFNGVWLVEDESQCLNIDGPVYVSEILEAADFIMRKMRERKA